MLCRSPDIFNMVTVLRKFDSESSQVSEECTAKCFHRVFFFHIFLKYRRFSRSVCEIYMQLLYLIFFSNCVGSFLPQVKYLSYCSTIYQHILSLGSILRNIVNARCLSETGNQIFNKEIFKFIE